MSRHGRSSSYTPSTNPYLPLQPASPGDPGSRRRRSSGVSLASETTYTAEAEAQWPNELEKTRHGRRWWTLCLCVLGSCSMVAWLVGTGNVGTVAQKVKEKTRPVIEHVSDTIVGSEKVKVVAPPVQVVEEDASSEEMEETEEPSAAPQTPEEPAPRLDRGYLLAAHIGEQESKASSHLYQLGLLALALNRTLVLPNAGIGYLGQCRKYPFSEWYAPDALVEWGVTSITQDEFRRQLQPFEDQPLRSRFITMGGSQDKLRKTELVAGRDPAESATLAKTWCLGPDDSSTLGRYISYPDAPLTVAGQKDWSKSEASRLVWGRDVIALLSSSDISSLPLLTVIWGSNYPGFSFKDTPIKIPDFLQPSITPHPTSTFRHLAYSPALIEIADRILAALGGPSEVVAVHWRQELVPLANLVRCGDELVKSLSRVRQEQGGARYLWMASDYPFEDAERGAKGEKIAANSGTFTKFLTQEHHLAMSKFLSALDGSSVPTYESLWLAGPKLSPPLDVDRMDRGTLGIIDKLVASKAGWFLAGRSEGSGFCGRGSSYTRAIISMRVDKGVGDGPDQLANDVEYWG